MDYTADWSYDGLAPERRDHLRDCPPYCEVIRRLADKLATENIEFFLDQGRYVPVCAALRPIFYVEVGEELGDWFFLMAFPAIARNTMRVLTMASMQTDTPSGSSKVIFCWLPERHNFGCRTRMIARENSSCLKWTYWYHCG